MSTDNEHARSLVICSLAQLKESSSLASTIKHATRSTRDRLVILLFSAHFDDHRKWHDVQTLLTWIYVQSTAVAQDMDKVLMEVDVLLRGSKSRETSDVKESEFDVVYKFEEDTSGQTASNTDSHNPPITGQFDTGSIAAESGPSFPIVAVGGTFDHLHAGHKILLSMTAWLATEKVIVGVTDDALLVNKSNKHVLQTIDERIALVRSFLTLFKPGLELSIVPINDVYGPTSWDPNIQALVVSKETLSGAAAIGKLRNEKGLPRLETFVIEVISTSEVLDDNDPEHLKKAKMSSTFIRQWIVFRKDRQ